MKRCDCCHEILPGDDFHKRKSSRDGLQSRCKKCQKRYLAERMGSAPRIRFCSNEERVRHRLDYIKKWQLSNKEKMSIYYSKREHSALRKEWKSSNRNRILSYASKRRALGLKNGGSFSGAEWLVLKLKYGNKCLCCSRVEPDIILQPDHVIPISRGGSGEILNIQPLCGTCNRTKNVKIIDYRQLAGG